MEATEIWKPIKGFEGLYEVSNLGRVKKLARFGVRRTGEMHHIKEKIYNEKPTMAKSYKLVTLNNGITCQTFTVYRLVAEHFVDKISGKTVVNHKNSNKRNDEADNLEWCTKGENIAHFHRTILSKKRKAAKNDMLGDLQIGNSPSIQLKYFDDDLYELILQKQLLLTKKYGTKISLSQAVIMLLKEAYLKD